MEEGTAVYKYLQGKYINERRGLVTIFWDGTTSSHGLKLRKSIVAISKRKKKFF